MTDDMASVQARSLGKKKKVKKIKKKKAENNQDY